MMRLENRAGIDCRISEETVSRFESRAISERLRERSGWERSQGHPELGQALTAANITELRPSILVTKSLLHASVGSRLAPHRHGRAENVSDHEIGGRAPSELTAWMERQLFGLPRRVVPT
jgi:hypothetical protein